MQSATDALGDWPGHLSCAVWCCRHPFHCLRMYSTPMDTEHVGLWMALHNHAEPDLLDTPRADFCFRLGRRNGGSNRIGPVLFCLSADQSLIEFGLRSALGWVCVGRNRFRQSSLSYCIGRTWQYTLVSGFKAIRRFVCLNAHRNRLWGTASNGRDL